MFPLWQTFSCIFVSHVSSSKVPACLRHSTARQATIFTEAALYRQGVPYQRQAFLTTIQTELKVFGTLPCGGYFYWTLFMTDLYHLNDFKKKKVNIKADTRKHFWMQFMTHQLHRLTAPDVQYVCWIYSCPVTGHWFAVRSLVFSDSERGPMILVKLMDLIESTGQRCMKRI